MHLDFHVANFLLSFGRYIKWSKHKQNFMTKVFMSGILCYEGI